MNSEDEWSGRGTALLDRDEVEGVLRGAFYTPAPKPALPVATTAKARAAAQAERPQHYKVICISMYTDDLAKLDEMVDALKARGLTKANRSALIRYALSGVDLDTVPRGM